MNESQFRSFICAPRREHLDAALLDEHAQSRCPLGPETLVQRERLPPVVSIPTLVLMTERKFGQDEHMSYPFSGPGGPLADIDGAPNQRVDPAAEIAGEIRQNRPDQHGAERGQD